MADSYLAPSPDTERLLKGVVEAARRMLTADDLESGFKEVLEALCEAMDQTRVVLFRHDAQEAACYMVDEALFPGCPSAAAVDPGPYYDSDYAEVMEPLKRGEIYTCATAVKSGANHELNTQVGTTIDLMVPIFVDGAFWGQICFDRIGRDQPFSEAEIDVLRGAVAVLAGAIDRFQKERKIIETEQSRAAIAEQTRAAEEKRRRLLEAVNEVSDQLLEASSWRDCADDIAEKIGVALGVDRITFGQFLPPDESNRLGYLEMLVEWARPPAKRQSDTSHLQRIDLDAYEDYFTEVSSGRPWQRHTDELATETARNEQEVAGAKSQFQYPIMVDGRFWGSIGADDCTEVRQWPEEEISTLQILASAFSNMIKREALTQERIAVERSRADEASAFNREQSRRNDLLKGVAEAACRMFAANDLHAGIKEVLAALCEAMEQTRVILVRHNAEEAACYLVDEALFHGCPSGRESYQGPLHDRDFPEVMEALMRGEIYTSATSIKSGTNHDINAKAGTQIDLMVPIFVEQRFWGHICFDRIESEQHFSEPEIDVLRGAAAVLAGAIDRSEKEQRLIEAERLRADENAGFARLLSSVARMSRDLLNAEDFEQALNDWLAVIGGSTTADAIGFYRKIRHPESGTETFEWSAQWWRIGSGSPVDVSFASPQIIDPLGNEAVMARMLSGNCAPIHTQDLDKGTPGKLQLEAQGTATVIHAPIIIDGAVWGLIGFDYTARQEPSDTALAVLQTTADSLAAVVQRNQLEEVLLNEQRDRADENAGHVGLLQDILIASRDMLGGEDFDVQLSQWLEHLGQSCGAHLSSYGLIEVDAETGAFKKIYPVAGWVAPAYNNQASNGDGIPLTQQFIDWTERLIRGEYVWATYSELKEPESRAYWDEVGCRSTLLVPVETVGPHAGWLCFDFVEERPENAVQISAIQTAAESLGAAMRQHAAQQNLLEAKRQRLEELSRMNTALAGSMQALSENATPERVVQGITELMAQTLGGEVGAVFLVNHEEGRLVQFEALHEDLEARPPDEPFDVSLQSIPAWERIIQNSEPTLMRAAAPEHDGIHPVTVAYMQERSLDWLINLPLLVNDEPRWLLAVCGRDESQLTESNLSLFKTLSHQLKLALELKRLGDESSQSLVAEAKTQAENAALEERAKLAGQIHDTLAQGFTGAMLHLEALIVHKERSEKIQASDLKRVRDIAAFGLSEARRTAIVIRPLRMDARSLEDALDQLAKRSNIPDLLECRFMRTGPSQELLSEVEECLLNIAHEAVSNALRHADANLISIDLHYSTASVALSISDNGAGFDIDVMDRSGYGFGIRSMRERVEQIKAHLDIESTVEAGTCIRIEYAY